MPGTRDHDPLIIEEFEGWWQRGDPDSAPSNHFIQADNIQYFQSGVGTRDGLRNYLVDPLPTLQILRVYNYTTQTGQTLLVLTVGGNIYHVKKPTDLVGAPILTIAEMQDFGFVAINGRAYISPFKTYVNAQGEKYQLGLQNVPLYVYNGDGTPARPAAGAPPTGQVVLANGVAGRTDTGLHFVGVVFETNSGYLTAPGAFSAQFTYSGVNKIDVSAIPTGPAPVIKRHLVSTKFIFSYNGDILGYQYFFIPNGTIPDNTTTTKTVEYFDSDLIADASHLTDNFSVIPSGVALNTYHSRMIIVGEYGNTETLVGLPPGITDNRSIARVSFPGEPESISKIDGLIVAPLDGHPLTNVQEFRDVLYLFKSTRTFSFSDNNDEPVTWQEEVLDQGIGAPVHGIATVLDTGGVNTDFLLIADLSGLMLFNGVFALPELTFKIEDFWRALNHNEFHKIEVANDSLNKKIWITLPEPHRKTLLHADYSDGLNPSKIKWARWIFDVNVFTIALVQFDRLLIGTPGPDVTGVEFQELL